MVRIYYEGQRWTSGLTDVLINIYNASGTKVVTNGAMTEIGTIGIYYYDYTPAATGEHIAVMNSASKPSAQVKVFEGTTQLDLLNAVKELRAGNEKITFNYTGSTLTSLTILTKADADSDWISPTSTKTIYLNYASGALTSKGDSE